MPPQTLVPLHEDIVRVGLEHLHGWIFYSTFVTLPDQQTKSVKTITSNFAILLFTKFVTWPVWPDCGWDKTPCTICRYMYYRWWLPRFLDFPITFISNWSTLIKIISISYFIK